MKEKNSNGAIPAFLFSPIEGVMQADDVLAKLFRIICLDLGILPETWLLLMERYLDNPRNGVGKSIKARSTEKNNLKRALESDTMTFKVLQKAIKFLGEYETTFIVELKNPRTGEIIKNHIRLLDAPMEEIEEVVVELKPKSKYRRNKNTTVHSVKS